jgi:hypothetical protein
MSENVTSAGKGLGIAGFVLGLVALVISFIPCLGMYALFPGIVAVILSVVAFMQANKGNGAKGLIIAAIVVSVIGTGIAAYQYSVLSSATSGLMELGEELQNMNEEQLEELSNDLEEGLQEAIEEAEEATDDQE